MINFSAYQNQVASPFSKMAQGYQTGAAIRQDQDQQTAIEAKKAEAMAMRTDLSELASNTNAGPDDYRKLITQYPSLSEHFSDTIKSLQEDQKVAKQNQALSVFSALEAGQNDIAKQILSDHLEAAQNSGDENEVNSTKALLQLVNINPDAARASSGLFLSSSMGEENFANTWSKLRETNRKDRLSAIDVEKTAAEVDLTKAQVNEVLSKTSKLGAETQKLALEIKALGKDGKDVPIDKKFDMEKKMRDDYNKRTSGYTESKRNLDIISTSAKDESGAGDIALVTSFMKMLDPGSVVRETEFATARDTAGLYTMMQNWAQKKTTGAFLSSTQRTKFAELASKYMEAAEKQEEKVRKDLDVVVKNYGLESENVFGQPNDEENSSDDTPSYMRHAGSK